MFSFGRKKDEATPPQPDRPQRPIVNVVGTFRSGTNLLKYLLEEYFETDVVFSKWYWKHALPPATRTRLPLPKRIPLVVLAKDPVEFNRSVCEFWRARRPELGTDHTLSEFIRKEFLVYDNAKKHTARYLFRDPTDYWNQFYFSYQNWPGVADRLQFVRIEDLIADTQTTTERVAQSIGLERRNPAQPIALPEKAVRPSSDKRSAKTGEPLTKKKQPISEEDRTYIWERVRPEIIEKLGYSSPKP